MDVFELKGYKIHISVKIPHLYELVPTFSYQFLIFNKEGKIMNYPFSVIIAQHDDEFKFLLNKQFDCYVNYTEVKAYPKSKFLEMVANNSL
ncbi:MAG: hypothetical protein JSV62_12800 [Promethearchaeota archaeon]|nr:MAG: hypothetical protein JSV62_12800 [Candidatus Lokiarchaeota archaeon]